MKAELGESSHRNSQFTEASFHANASAQQAPSKSPFLPFSMWFLLPLPCLASFLLMTPHEWLNPQRDVCVCVLARGELPLFGTSVRHFVFPHPPKHFLTLRSDGIRSAPAPAESPAEFSALGQTASLSHIPFCRNFFCLKTQMKSSPMGSCLCLLLSFSGFCTPVHFF